MPSTYSPLLRLELIGAGEQSGLWGDTTNKNVGQLLEQAIAGVTTVSLSGGAGDYTLSALDGTFDESRSAVLKFIGTPSGVKNIIIPTETKLYVVRNDCGQTITVKTAAQVTGVTLLNGEASLVFCDGTNAVAGIATAGVGPTTVANGGTGATSFIGGFVKSPGGTGILTSSATVNAATELSGVVGLTNGGTGATSAATALTSLGAYPASNPNGYTSNTGTVTSVGASVPSFLSLSGSPITTSGTLAIGYSGVALPVANGGTGQNTLPAKAVIIGNGTSPVDSVSPGALGQVLTSNGVSWISQAPATSGGTVTSVGFSTGTTGLSVIGTNPITSSGTFTLSGTLNVLNGGTGATSLTGILRGNGTGAFSVASGSEIATAIGASAVTNANNVPFSGVSSKPTTLSGYGITDAVANNIAYDNPGFINSLAGSKISSAVASATNATQLDSVAASSYARLDTTQTFTGAKTFTGSITSTAYNMTTFTSMYTASNNIFWSIGTSGINNIMTLGSTGNLNIAGTLTQGSDPRLKDDIEDYTKGLETLKNIRVRSWTYNGKGNTVKGRKAIGVVATEIESYMPEMIINAEGKLNPEDVETTTIKNVDSLQMTWLLVKSVQELKAEVDSLKVQLAAK